VDVTATYRLYELEPFRKLIDGGAEAIMTAHIMNRSIDPEYPATHSEKFINGILRDELGFEGVVISDDMQMGAITEHYGFEEALILAVNAGVDILALSNNIETYDGAIGSKTAEIVFQAVKDGRIERARIHESYERIMALKRTYGLAASSYAIP
jgi:beta-N-acetylhexosaminidase